MQHSLTAMIAMLSILLWLGISSVGSLGYEE